MTQAWLISAVCVALFAIHNWVLWGHRVKMGSDPSDRPQDSLFSRRRQTLAFTAMFFVQASIMVQRILVAFQEPPAWNFAVGVVVFLIGLALRLWAVHLLGRFFTFEIGIRPEHRIIEVGPYRLIRHPSYTGYLLMLAGMSVAYDSLIFFILIFLPVATFLMVRLHQEEKMLRAHFGPAYSEYMKRTKRLVPFIY